MTKSLLCAVSALMLASGAAFAGQDSSVDASVEMSPPETDAYSGPMSEEQSLEEYGVIYVYPVEVTEYWLVIPSQSSEMPG